jgi:cell division protein FtsB
MAEFKKKEEYSFWYSPLSIVILFIIFSFLVYKVIDLIKKEKETAEKKELILDEIDELRKREDILNKDISKMQTEDGIEDAIREKYKVVKEGEKMVVIVDNRDQISLEKDMGVDNSFIGWLKGLLGNK